MRRVYVACLLFAVAFGYYLSGLGPSVSVGDSGEFMTAAATLGVPHAPGFPAYVYSAHAFATLMPWGNPGYQINLYSAFTGALTVSLIFLCLQTVGLGSAAAVFAALFFLFSKAPTLSGRGTEVFSLHALLVVSVLWAAVAREWILLALLGGLSMGNHQTVLFVVPGIVLSWAMTRAWPDPRQWSRLVAAGVAGLVLYLAVYIRAGHQPFLNVGQGDSLERLWRIFTRADYGSLTLALGDAPERSLEMVWRHLERFLTGLADQTSWLGIVIIAAGAWCWFKKDNVCAWLFTGAFLALGPFFFWLGNLPFNAQSTGLLGRFYVAPLVCAALLAAMAIERLAEKSRKAAWILALIPVGLAFRAEAMNLRHDYVAYAYGRNNLRTLAPHALCIMDGGDDTFYTLAYLTQVERRRPDVELHDRGGVVFSSLYGDDFRRLSHDDKESRRQVVEKSLLSGGRPVYFSTMNPQVVPDVPLRQNGILYGRELQSEGWPFYDLRDVAPWMASSLSPISDYRLRALEPFYSYQRAIESAREGSWGNAKGFLRSASAVGQGVLWLMPNVNYTLTQWAYQCFQKGLFDQARQYYLWFLVLNPTDPAGWINLGALNDRQNRLAEAIEDYQKALALAPGSAQAHYNLAVCYWKESRWSEVETELTTVLQIDPHYPGAQAYLAKIQSQSSRR